MERKKGRYHGESNLPKKTYLHYIGKKTIWFSSLLKNGIFFFIYKTQNTKNSALNDTYY